MVADCSSGYRKVLRPQDLHNIDTELINEELDERFQRKWHDPSNRSMDNPLLWTLCSVLKYDIFLPVLPRFEGLPT